MVRRPRFAARAIWVSGFWGTTFTSKGPVARWLMGSLLKAPSVGHRRQLICERIFEPEVAQIPHPLRKEDAVEVIDLMLHDAGVKTLHGPVDRRSLRIESPIAQAAEPRHEARSEEHTSELQSLRHLVCRLLLEKKKKKIQINRL